MLEEVPSSFRYWHQSSVLGPSQICFAFPCLIFSPILTLPLSLSFYREVLFSAFFWSSQDLRIVALVFFLSDLNLSYYDSVFLSLTLAFLSESLSHLFKP